MKFCILYVDGFVNMSITERSTVYILLILVKKSASMRNLVKLGRLLSIRLFSVIF